MSSRAAIFAGAALLAAVAGGGLWYGRSPAPAEPMEAADPSEPLPIPPVPPRLAQGEEYEQCLAMLNSDPTGAAAMADAWAKKGGGDGATHCLALSRIAQGDPAGGAEMLQALAGSSHGATAARATIYAQATQAWMIAGDINHAFGSATLALALSPDDADLLLDRATAAGNLERYQDAIDDLTHALDVDPTRADVLTLRAAAWRHFGQLELAQDDVDRALAIDPDSPEALLERGILRQRHNDRAGARTDWERAIDLAPDSPTADLAEQNIALLDAGPDRR
jgi:tetratricopeptide (TPR) repeat protein